MSMGIIGSKEKYHSSSETGGKARGLLTILQCGLPTPTFYLINHHTISEVLNRARTWSDVLGEWKTRYGISDSLLWAVRSSAALEDGIEKSYAGQYLTRTNIPTLQLESAIGDVLNSYSGNNDTHSSAEEFGLVIQEMLSPDYSGVLFTRHPVNPLDRNPVINISPGLGEKMVEGAITAYQVSRIKDQLVFPQSETEYEGTYYQDGDLKTRRKKANVIKEEIAPFLEKLHRGSRVLEKKINSPLDIEFAISEGQLYWLQVRPMTIYGGDGSLSVWDNTQAEANFPGLTLPLSISFYKSSMETVYSMGGEAIGFRKRIIEQNRELIGQMAGGIHGALYYNVSAWQANLYQLPYGNRLSNLLPTIWGMAEAPYNPPAKRHNWCERLWITGKLIGIIIKGRWYEREYQRVFQSTLEEFGGDYFSGRTFGQLIEDFAHLRDRLGKGWLAPISNGLFTMVSFSILKQTVRKSKLHKHHPNFENDILFAQGEVVSVNIVKSFYSLLESIYLDKNANQLFFEGEPEEILRILKSDFANLHTQIMEYIEKFGNRTREGELKMETTTYKQSPESFIEYLKSNLKSFTPSKKKSGEFDYRAVIREHYPLNFLRRLILYKLVRATIQRVKIRENHRFMRTNMFALYRDLFVAMGQSLYEEQLLNDRYDIFYLELDELLIESQKRAYKSMVAQRKREYRELELINRESRYIHSGEDFIPIPDMEKEITAKHIKGIGCCSGLVEGKVMVIDRDSDLSGDYSNAILVGSYFEPGWIGLFSQAKGVISERGNLLSHTSIICREMNVPSIVGARGILNAVKELPSVKMDGSTGIIYLAQDESF